MNEQKNEQKSEVSIQGDKPGIEGLSIVEEAKKVRDEIRAENDRREAILKQEQNLQAERMLAGTAGGRVEPQAPREETAKEYADRVMKNQVTAVKHD